MVLNVNKFQKNNQKGAFEADLYIRIALREVRGTLNTTANTSQ